MKSEDEKMKEMSKIPPPSPRVVYQVKATRVGENFICYINVLAWERIAYPKEDAPISVC